MPRPTLLAAARRAGVRIGHPCRGEGVCGKCAVTITGGDEWLDPPTEIETELLAHVAAGPNDRLACLATVRPAGLIELRVGGGTYRVRT